jgi:hypothetical protein
VRVRYTERVEGPGPSEAVVTIRTAGGAEEEVIVHRGLIEDNTIPVGAVTKEGSSVLVELPQESTAGKWRVWVSDHDLS